MSFSVSYAGVTKPLAEWSIIGAKLQLRSADVDELTFSVPVRPTGESDSFTPGATLDLFRDSERIFSGKIQAPSRSFQNGKIRDNYSIKGPWFDLNQIMALQLWTIVDTDTETEQSANQCRILFGVNSSGFKIRTGAMLAQLIDNAIARGLLIARGTILLGIEAPSWEQADLTIAEAIVSILKWHPSAICWFDYATTKPTLHIKLAANMPTIYLNLSSSPPEALQVKPRTDLLIYQVAIIYELTKEYKEVTVLVNGVYKKTTLATAISHNWTITSEGQIRQYEALKIDKSPSGLNVSAPKTLIHSISWTDTGYSPPNGVADAIRTESSQLYVEGSVTYHSQTLLNIPWLGRRLEFYPASWSGMAIVNSVSLDLALNTLSVGFGPGGTLGVQDWIDLLKRSRVKSGDAARIVSGRVASAYNAIPDEVLEATGMPEGFEELTLTLSQTGSTLDRILLVKTPEEEE